MGEQSERETPEEPDRYPNLHAVPTKQLATNIVTSLIMAKGSINKWHYTIEHFLEDYRAEEKAALEKNERLRAGDVERVKTLDFLERERHHALGRASTAEARIEAVLALHNPVEVEIGPDEYGGSGPMFPSTETRCVCGATWRDGYCQSPTIKILQGQKP